VGIPNYICPEDFFPQELKNLRDVVKDENHENGENPEKPQNSSKFVVFPIMRYNPGFLTEIPP
jgi:hypothetical protein